MPKLVRVSCTLECPPDWDLIKVAAFLRRQILTSDSEVLSLEMEIVDEPPKLIKNALFYSSSHKAIDWLDKEDEERKRGR